MNPEPDKAGWHVWELGPDGRPATLDKVVGFVACRRCLLVKRAASNRRVWLYKVAGHWTNRRPDCRVIAADSSDGPTSA